MTQWQPKWAFMQATLSFWHWTFGDVLIRRIYFNKMMNTHFLCHWMFAECKCRENVRDIFAYKSIRSRETTFDCSHIAIFFVARHCFKHPVERFQITCCIVCHQIIFHLWQKSAFVPHFDCHHYRSFERCTPIFIAPNTFICVAWSLVPYRVFIYTTQAESNYVHKCTQTVNKSQEYKQIVEVSWKYYTLSIDIIT